MRAVIYARFSSDRQTEMSIDAQVRACREYADKRGINIIRIYADEAISGTTNARPKYQEMLSDAFGGSFDLILIHKYDRIARNLEEQVSLQSRLKKLNIRLIAVAQDYGEGKDANLTKGIQWVLGEYYSANLSEEVKKGHKEIALKGLHNGGYPPFGYDVKDQRYVINEIEAKYVKEMFSVCLLGGTYSDLIGRMNAAGITGKRGKPIKYSQIYDILRNEKYTGVYLYTLNEEPNRAERRSKVNAIRIEGAIPAIISKDDFEKVQIILKGRTRRASLIHPCSGIVYCKECGAKMHINRSSRRGHTYERFRCSAKCGAKGVDTAFVSEAVETYLKALFSDTNASELERAIKELRKYNNEKSKAYEYSKKKEIARLRSEISNIMEGLASGAFKGNYEECNSLITEKKEAITGLENEKIDIIDDKEIRNWLKAIATNNYAPKVFIKRINASIDEIEIISNFENIIKNPAESSEDPVGGYGGCGGTISIIPPTMYGFRLHAQSKMVRTNKEASWKGLGRS